VSGHVESIKHKMKIRL